MSFPGAVGRTLVALGNCCWGSIIHGPTGCTCWLAVFSGDATQAEPDRQAEPGTRSSMCDDCAYRPDSPERNGDDRQTCSDEGDLDHLALSERPFWCHRGMRKVIAWVHPAGIRIEADGDDYSPPVIDGTPYKANGEPGERCAGWAARKRQLEAEARS